MVIGMKKFLSTILALIIACSSILSLAGCSTKGQYTLTVGEWLEMVNGSFGMLSYNSDEPYFSNVDADNKYYEAVQIATEWDVISTDDNIDVDKNLKWQDALVTLVNVGNFLPMDRTIEEKIDCAIASFDQKIRKYWMNRDISLEDATALLAEAQNSWANRKYSTPVEEKKFADGVVDLTEEKINYEVNNDVIVIDGVLEETVSAGDTYVLPSCENSLGTKIFKAENIVVEDGKTYIKNSNEEINAEEVIEELFLQETIVPTATNSVVYDGNGNVIGGNAALVDGASGVDFSGETPTIGYLGSGTAVAQGVAVTNKHTFKIDGYEVSLSYKLDGGFDLEAGVKKDMGDGWTWSVSAGVSNVDVTNEIDISWFKLKSALVKLDYDTKTTFAVKYEQKLVDKVFAPYNNGNGKGLTNLKKAVLKDSAKAGGNGAQTIKLCSVDVYSIGVARVCLDVNLQITIEGSVKIVVTTSNSKGVEYKNGNLRFINDTNKNFDIESKAKIEATIGVGPALYAVGLKKQIIGFQAAFGVGAAATVKMHLADVDNHLIEECSFEDTPPEAYSAFMQADITADSTVIQAVAESQGGEYRAAAGTMVQLHTDICIDIALYWILKLGITDTSWAADLLGGKIKISYDAIGEKNGKFAYVHVEDFDFIKGFSNIVFGSQANSANLCTKQYKPFDKAEEVKEEDQSFENKDDDTILKGDRIVLSEISGKINIGDKYNIDIEQLPKGYEAKDIKVKVKDKKTAKVNADGSVEGLNAGSTMVTVYTADEKYFAYVALTVVDPEEVKLSEWKWKT